VPAEQVADTIFTSVTLNSLSPEDDEEDEADGDADGVLADGDALEAELVPNEPLTST
jgi:hypothetical protein